MRVCLLFDGDEGVLSERGGVDLPGGPHTHLPQLDWTLQPLFHDDAIERLAGRLAEGYDAFFNLCDGAADEERPGIDVVRALEEAGVAFTGATSDFYEPSRDAMKAACARAGVGAPAHVVVDGAAADGAAETEAAIERAAGTLDWPLIVKHPSSYSSIGLTPDSVVETRAALEREIRRAIDDFGAALVEEYVAGREFTVLVLERSGRPDRPIAYPPIEFRFPPGETFKHYRLKWYDWKGMEALPLVDPALENRLREESARFFVALGGTGYARCDVRMDAGGRLNFLEINPNCGVYYPLDEPGSADLSLMHHPEGHAGFTSRVLEAGLARRRP
ncbi:MAG: D-alanine--D-alanine ligase [Gemmatimonadota bacterium]|nr:D-alanine--D-alanine ligase [Gemmatimonadota bacterium]